jgi:hypothetical protein
MTTLVETSEEEPTMAVARAIAELAWYEGGPDVSLSLLSFLSNPSSHVYLKMDGEKEQ